MSLLLQELQAEAVMTGFPIDPLEKVPPSESVSGFVLSIVFLRHEKKVLPRTCACYV
jgi:hypothetical protein